MSGDVQPRKRKDKRRKKDSSSSDRAKAEAEYIARKLSVADDSDESAPAPKSSSHHAASQLSEGDSVIHVHHEGGTGGHWCAKIVFFILLGALVFLVGLIILENRGLTDLDTPVAESRYAQVFDGWVDEGPIHDDHHDEHTLELKNEDDSHEEDTDDEHADEVEDIEEEHGDTDTEDEHSDDEDDTPDHDSNENQSDEDEDNDESAENQNDDSEEDEKSNEQDDSNEPEGYEQDDDDDDDEDEYLNNSQENDNDDDDANQKNDDDDDANDENDDDDDANEENDDDDDNDSKNIDSSENDLPFEEVDSMEEEVVDNAAGEDEHIAAKQAEQLAQEQEESGIGMRVGIGLALVVVAYCVLARKWQNASDSAEGTPQRDLDRRMTLIPDEEEIIDEAEREIEEKIAAIEKKISAVDSKLPESIFARPKQIIHRYVEDEDDDIVIVKETPIDKKTAVSSQKVNVEEPDDEIEEDEKEEEEIEEVPREEFKNTNNVDPADEDEDVIDEELLDEEEEDIIEEEIEEEEEEEISEEMDDSDLMKKLEEKYGKLPQLEDDQPEGYSDEDVPVTPARKKGKPFGGNAIDEAETEDWADDTNDDWKKQLDLAQAEMDEGRIEEAYRLFTALTLTNESCSLAKLGRAKAIDFLAEKKRSNNLLQASIDEYLSLLDMNLNDKIYRNVAERVINRIRFKGKHLEAVAVHERLISKFPSQPEFRNQLAITYLMVNKVELARSALQNTLKLWPNDGVALVHYGFILKTVDNNLSKGVHFMQRGVDTGAIGTMEGRFLFHLGDAYARLGQNEKANKIYDLGAELKVFLSPQQRSLYNVGHLTGRPWWTPEATTYAKLIKDLEENWVKIAQEAKNVHPTFKPEQENLKDTGVWSQYELYVRGVEVKSHCSMCPVTCSIVRREQAAIGCRRGQIKFSAMDPNTHVFAHTGPTNCRLRAHLGLTGTKGTFIRVANETRSWQEGKVFIFDDSFDHEVWHNGTELRIVLIVDLWHPELTKEERAALPSI